MTAEDIAKLVATYPPVLPLVEEVHRLGRELEELRRVLDEVTASHNALAKMVAARGGPRLRDLVFK